MASRPAVAARPNSSRQRSRGKHWNSPASGGSSRPCMMANRRISLLGDRHEHVGAELVTIEEGPEVLERLGHEGAVGALHGGEARLSHLVQDDVNVADERSGPLEDAID